MNKYESVVIINPNVEENALKELIERFQTLINTDGKVEQVNELGKKKLAYEIKQNKEGTYLVTYFQAKSKDISKLEKFYRMLDEIIKFMTIKED